MFKIQTARGWVRAGAVALFLGLLGILLWTPISDFYSTYLAEADVTTNAHDKVGRFGAFVEAVARTKLFVLCLGLAAGFIIGIWLDYFLRRFDRAVPKVSQWFPASQAWREFGDASRLRDFDRAIEQRDEARERHKQKTMEAQKLSKLVGPVGPASIPGSDVVRQLTEEAAKAFAEISQYAEEAERIKMGVVASMVDRLRRGELAAQGFPLRDNQIATELVLIPAKLWGGVLAFARYSDMKDVEGSGHRFIAVEIGRNLRIKTK